jgi:hypothetical protein
MPGARTPGPPGSGNGHVIQLGDRRRTARTGAAMPMGGSAAYQPDDDHDTDPNLGLAQTLEAMFLHSGHTLTDDDTGEAFDITLAAVELMLDGALAQGHMSTEAHQVLRGMTEGMRNARQLL